MGVGIGILTEQRGQQRKLRGQSHSREEGVQSTEGNAYMVPEGGVLDGVLSSQGNAAEQNEEEDQVGEDRVIDNGVALEAKSAWGGGAKEKLVSKARDAGLGSGPHVLLSRTEVLAGLGSGLFSLQSY